MPPKGRQSDWAPWTLRLPPGLREQLEAIAQAERRSLNNQIVVILEAYVAGREQRPNG